MVEYTFYSNILFLPFFSVFPILNLSSLKKAVYHFFSRFLFSATWHLSQKKKIKERRSLISLITFFYDSRQITNVSSIIEQEKFISQLRRKDDQQNMLYIVWYLKFLFCFIKGTKEHHFIFSMPSLLSIPGEVVKISSSSFYFSLVKFCFLSGYMARKSCKDFVLYLRGPLSKRWNKREYHP